MTDFTKCDALDLPKKFLPFFISWTTGDHSVEAKGHCQDIDKENEGGPQTERRQAGHVVARKPMAIDWAAGSGPQRSIKNHRKMLVIIRSYNGL